MSGSFRGKLCSLCPRGSIHLPCACHGALLDTATGAPTSGPARPRQGPIKAGSESGGPLRVIPLLAVSSCAPCHAAQIFNLPYRAISPNCIRQGVGALPRKERAEMFQPADEIMALSFSALWLRQISRPEAAPRVSTGRLGLWLAALAFRFLFNPAFAAGLSAETCVTTSPTPESSPN